VAHLCGVCGWPTFAGGVAKVGGEGADATLIPCPTRLDRAHAPPSYSLPEAIKKLVAVGCVGSHLCKKCKGRPPRRIPRLSSFPNSYRQE
jgi:hypothetical protein